MYEYPFGNGQQLNLDWFLAEWKNLLAAWEAEKNGIAGALDAEIAKAEAALADVFAARDAAAQSAANALESKNAAAQSASDASGYLATVRADANAASNAAQNADASKRAAAQSASNASGYLATVRADANTASNAAQNAGQSAADADASKRAAAQSASNADESKSAAAQSAEDAENAANSVEASAEQITTNTSDITDLKNKINNDVAKPVINSAKGNPAIFTDGADNIEFKKLILYIDPKQSGSGDPSPINVRPFNTWDSVALTISPTANEEDGETNIIQIPNDAKPFYIGYVDYVNKEITINGAIYDLSNLTYTYRNRGLFSASLPNLLLTSRGGKIACSCYASSEVQRPEDLQNNAIWARKYAFSQTNICIRDSNYTDTELFKQSLIGQYVVYRTVTETKYPITIETLKTLYGDNYIFGNSGKISAEYVADTKLYIDTKLAEIQALTLENNGG